MDSFEDSNSSEMFEKIPNDNRHIRCSMEECSSAIDVGPQGCSRESEEEIIPGTSRKINYESLPLVPKVAVQEKIIICIENSQVRGLGYSFGDLNENIKEPSTYAIRNKAIRMFMVNKLALAKDTEFAIVAVEPGKLKILSYLTSNIANLSKSLGEYKFVFSTDSNAIDITSIFSELLVTLDIPEYRNATIPPCYIVRVIFVYSSSFNIPQVNTNDPSYSKYIMSPYFFFDVFYLHEKPTDCNHVDRIYKELGKIVSPSSYILESSRDVTKLLNSTMKLLAHPNQRNVESVWNF